MMTLQSSIATSLGTSTTNNDLVIAGGAHVTVTRTSDTNLRIDAVQPTGGATFRGTVDVSDDNTLPATAGQQNPGDVAVGDAYTVETTQVSANVTANWDTVLDNWASGDATINSGDVIICVTAATEGNPTNARYRIIRTGGVNTLQTVTTAGNFATNDILLGNTAASPNIQGLLWMSLLMKGLQTPCADLVVFIHGMRMDRHAS